METINEKPLRYFTKGIPRVPDHDFPFRNSLPLQIRFSDIDIFAHVNNNVYSSMVDIGKIHYFKSVMRDIDFSHLAIVVASIHFDFLEPTHLTDTIEVWTTTTEIGKRSFKLEQRIVDSTTGHIKCLARSVMCAIQSDGISAVLPEEWVNALEAYEERQLTKPEQ